MHLLDDPVAAIQIGAELNPVTGDHGRTRLPASSLESASQLAGPVAPVSLDHTLQAGDAEDATFHQAPCALILFSSAESISIVGG